MADTHMSYHSLLIVFFDLTDLIDSLFFIGKTDAVAELSSLAVPCCAAVELKFNHQIEWGDNRSVRSRLRLVWLLSWLVFVLALVFWSLWLRRWNSETYLLKKPESILTSANTRFRGLHGRQWRNEQSVGRSNHWKQLDLDKPRNTTGSHVQRCSCSLDRWRVSMAKRTSSAPARMETPQSTAIIRCVVMFRPATLPFYCLSARNVQCLPGRETPEQKWLNSDRSITKQQVQLASMRSLTFLRCGSILEGKVA